MKRLMAFLMMLVCLIVLGGCTTTENSNSEDEGDYMDDYTLSVGLGGGALYHIVGRTRIQSMSYLIETPDGKIVMIDGGWGTIDQERAKQYLNMDRYIGGEDARYLYNLLAERGKKVDLWLITHAHSDHFSALTDILDTDIEIGELRYDFPPMEWLERVENGGSAPFIKDFLDKVEESGVKVGSLKKGENISCGGVKIEVLTDAGNYARYDNINDTSCVLRVAFPKQDVLFLGDLGPVAGDDVLKEVPAEKLRCDIVQMAHHGQDGVSREFYEVVAPKICLYPAPDWLWDNNHAGMGKDTGPWKTLIVRGWMEELGVEQSISDIHGDYRLR